MTRTTRTTRTSTAVAALLLAATLTGCGGGSDGGSGESRSTPAAGAAQQADTLLADHGLEGMPTADLIEHLDTLAVAERPQGLIASVRPDTLVVSDGAEEVGLPIPGDRFYLSVAPYVDRTHDCFHHSLTTCTGELDSTEIQVRLVDETNDKVLVEETRTTSPNGFTGFWLPRGIEGTLQISQGGRTGEVDFGTGPDDPTCLTTLQLV